MSRTPDDPVSERRGAVFEVLRSDGYREMPWRNGGGVTWAVATSPEGSGMDRFDWRVSIAEVRAAGQFSTFPGVDRVIMPIGDAGMLLRLGDAEQILGPGAPYAFSGDIEVSVELPFGPTRDLNLMTRRGRCRGGIAVLQEGDSQSVTVPAGETALLIAFGAWASVAHDGHPVARLEPTDGLRVRGPSSLSVHVVGFLGVVSVQPPREALSRPRFAD